MSVDIDTLCPVTINAALSRAAILAPDVEAIIGPDGRMTYAQLAQEVASLRASLAGLGVVSGDHVGLCLGNGVGFVALFLALGSIGAVTVPINTRFKATEIAYALQQSRVKWLFSASHLLSNNFTAALKEICPEVETGLPGQALPALCGVVILGDDVPASCMRWDAFRQLRQPVSAMPKPDNTLLIQYTSGTTAFPKGVMLTHRNMLGNAFVSGQRIGLRSGDRVHSARPFFHVAGSTLSILAALQHMVTLVTMTRFEPAEALQLMETERCTHFFGNDTMALMLLSHPSLPSRRLYLRGAWVAGAQTVLRRVAAELGATEIVSGYGLSEASPNIAQSCWWEPEEIRTGGLMRLQPGLELIIRDPQTGFLLPANETGEILVRGWSVMKGYFGMPELTATTISPEGWLSTGDLGRQDEAGRLRFVGRLKNIIRVGGENVSPEGVEDMLHRHPAIKQAQVVGVPDARLVEVCAAFVILQDGESLIPQELIDWSRAHMAGFKVPQHVWIVESFEGIGMTASAKVQKTKLAEYACRMLANRDSA